MKIDKSLFPDDTHFLLDLLQSNDWPLAAPKFLICNDTDKDKSDRAEGILNYMGENFTNRKFCDFGCGEGHVAKEVGKTSVLSVGYDIVKEGNLPWETTQDGFTLTNNLDKVKESAPYDFILLYDVLDHSQNPVEVLQQVKSISNENTKVIVRCHSWMSRHATHLYQKINKAWIHLVFTEEELKLMGLEAPFTQKYFFPIGQQEGWFKAAGFSVVSSDVIKSEVEPFFRKPKIVSRLPMDKFKDFPEWQMSQSFNDYVLKLG